MALARSASGPGLSINTSSANSLFGSGTTPAPAGGMFGSQAGTQTSKPLFGALPTTTAPQTGTSIFGSTTASSQPQIGTGNLFASTTAATSQPAGPFGSAATTSQPTGLFGSTATTQPQTGGLFGSSIFGNTTSAQPATGGVFSNNQNQNKPATSLFGSIGTSQNQQPQQSTMFSSLNQPQAQSVQGLPSGHFPGSSFGGALSVGQNNQQQQTVPGVKIDTANIRGATRFNDLHEDLQKQIELMDTIIDQQIQMKNQCDAIMPSHDFQLSSIPADVDFCRRKLKGLDTAMIADVQAIAHVKEYISSDLKNATLIFKAVEVLKLPNQYHNAPGLSYKNPQTGDNQSQSSEDTEAQDLVGLFSSNADELSATLAKYKNHIGEIEQHLRSVEESSAQQVNALIARRNGGIAGDEDNIRQLAEALTEFEQSIFHVAGKVGGIKEGILRLGGTPFGTTNARSTNGHRSGVY